MRWIPWFILAYVALGVQMGLGDFVRVRGATPSLVLLAVIFIALNAPREAALLGAFGIGIMQDMTTLSPLGLYALAYAVVAMFVVSTQEIIYNGHPLTHFSLGLIGSFLMAMVVMAHGWVRGPRTGVAEMFAGAVYTAVLAPVVIGGLQKIRRVFAFSRRRVNTA